MKKRILVIMKEKWKLSQVNHHKDISHTDTIGSQYLDIMIDTVIMIIMRHLTGLFMSIINTDPLN
ncbi:hypothetical protein P5G61_21390 [Paenibacillus sp. F6_3S_P_1C]|uniref:Uncharacterized protein n=1 Tax=Paenibacillus vandeheii TaxID=3035917 RepID=A0ABT8JH61_9BACL|nr:hypothetical protein [Paenibacillus vandeheii]